MANLIKEIWTGETIKAFRSEEKHLKWMQNIPDFSSFVVDSSVLHVAALGADPKVLLNNSSYPLAVTKIDDADKALSLDKFQTQPTPVTDDEIFAISYDKKTSVIERHRDAIVEAMHEYGANKIAPASNSNDTPVLETTGENVGGRKALTTADIIALKLAFDKKKIPSIGRTLLLCPDHLSDLLKEDATFLTRYHNTLTGDAIDAYGFKIYSFHALPYYTIANKNIVAYGTSPASGTTRQASIAFYDNHIVRAMADAKVYIDEPNTTNQQWQYAVRQRFLCAPAKAGSQFALLSPNNG